MSRPVPSTLTSPTPPGVATPASRDLDQQDSTPPRAQQDFTSTGPPRMPPPTARGENLQLVLGPRVKNSVAPNTGRRECTLQLAESRFGGVTPVASPGTPRRSHRGRSSSSPPSSYHTSHS